MSQPITLMEDMFVVPRHTQGTLDLQRIIEQAEEQNLERICFCLDSGASGDESTAWAKDVREAAAWASIEVYSGQEAELINEEGLLNLPPGPIHNDFILLSARRCPLGERSFSHREIKDLVQQGPFRLHHIRQVAILALARALQRYQNVILADLHSSLPGERGETEWEADPQATELLEILVSAAEDSGAGLLVNEGQRCPSAAVTQRFRQSQVPIFFGTGGQWSETNGRYAYAKEIYHGLLNP